MSRTTKVIAGVAVAFAITIGLLAMSTDELRTEIIIDRPPADVWATFSEFGTYGEWNPFVKRIGGNMVPGEYLEVTLQAPDSDPMDFSPEVLRYEPGVTLRWIGRVGLPRVFDGEHYFELEDLGDGRTRFIHGEDFRGVLVPFFGGIVENAGVGFGLMNVALKARVEAKGLGAGL